MAVGDLTTLANVKAWRSPALTSTDDDAAIQREITAASKAILQVVQRASLAFASYTESRNGQGTPGMLLRNYPVIAVTGLTIDNQTIQPATNQNNVGYVFDTLQGMLYLRGFVFCTGFQNVLVTYTAGTLQDDEDLTVDPGTFKVLCSSLSQLWCSDAGVIYHGGAALVPVKTSPAMGQYVPPAGPDGFYLFNSGDGGAAVDVSYGYTPRDVEEACIDTVILEYNRRSTIGQNGMNLAGENVTYYTTAAFTKTIESRLRSYMNVVPNE